MASAKCSLPVRLVELLEALSGLFDYFGECDRCHCERPLYIDHSEPGEFAYCETCIRGMVRKAKGGAQ